MIEYVIMKKYFISVLVMVCLVCVGSYAGAQSVDIRGPWEGTAQGSIFGAQGTVYITQQAGEAISGIVEGSNFLGSARFGISGRVRGNYIYGEKEGHTFEGMVYPDWTIRGMFRASNGEKYSIFLRKTFSSSWGSPYGY